MRIYAPDGPTTATIAAGAHAAGDLKGLTIGILDNTKPNAGLLLNRMAERLAERTGAIVGPVETKNAALAAPDQVMGRLTRQVQLVLTGSAD
ncbi:MAG: hypothetical protein HKN26_11865 [Acidimicrobiales bacterium]|nr:hypothetical protein [Acidimicrobiales bacterium]